MKYIITFLLFLSLPMILKSQPIDSLKSGIENLELREKSIQNQIDSLNSELITIEEQISQYKTIVNRLELEQQAKQGYPTKVSGAYSKLRDEPSIAGNVLVELDDGDEILVYDWFKNPYVKASYGDKVGYISYGALKENDFVRSLKNKIQEDEISEIEKDNPRYSTFVKRYGSSIAKRIINNEVWVGMTEGMARASWGSPRSVNRTTSAYGVSEQWVYPNSKYLYFEDGILTTIQD